jgi:hypothetical protein
MPVMARPSLAQCSTHPTPAQETDMQEEQITDVDGVTRFYAFDVWDGSLYQKTEASKRQNPGRPYFFVASLPGLENSVRSAEGRTLRTAHSILWSKPERAKELLAREPRPGEAMRSAHAA